ncbi:hypothetical protein GGI20_005282, partial [Coemansia sp. BCRC 34301]
MLVDDEELDAECVACELVPANNNELGAECVACELVLADEKEPSATSADAFPPCAPADVACDDVSSKASWISETVDTLSGYADSAMMLSKGASQPYVDAMRFSKMALAHTRPVPKDVLDAVIATSIKAGKHCDDTKAAYARNKSLEHSAAAAASDVVKSADDALAACNELKIEAYHRFVAIAEDANFGL